MVLSMIQYIKSVGIYNLLKYRNIFFGDTQITKMRFKKVFGYELNLSKPITLNEKMQWLKLNYRNDLQTILADKYAARFWLAKRFGQEYVVPLVLYTDNVNNICPEKLPDYPVIIKSNNGCGTNRIIRDKRNVDWESIRWECRSWLKQNHYYISQEWPYKNIKPYIIIEKLLMLSNGSIPNDYKLHYFNGNLEFIYCSINRETTNNRNIYDKNWEPLYFSWVESYKQRDNLRGSEIQPPKTFELMKAIGKEIANLFPYVRVDFYDVDGQLYYGEVTFYHGGGFDTFEPFEYDKIYGDKLKLNLF